MTLNFNSIAIAPKAFALMVILLLNLGVTKNVRAQSSFGDPIINITFGAGAAKYGPPLSAAVGVTSYPYVARSPDDNEYTIVNTSAQTNNGWFVTSDHTGDAGGYFMLVNASYNPGIFYTKTITNLCGGTTYQFAAWVKNVLRGANGIKPNITFSVETVSGTFLGGGSTGDIPNGNDVWVKYDFTFRTPNNSDPIVLKMVNNAPGGGGNDIAIDDITFRAEGAAVQVAFDQGGVNLNRCEGAASTITLKVLSTLPTGYVQKAQRKIGAGPWTDMTPEGTQTSFQMPVPGEPGIYRYRVATGQTANVSNPLCLIASNELVVNVEALSVPDIRMVPINCIGSEVEMTHPSASTGEAFLWDFGDGSPTSTLRSPKHVYSAAGDYTVSLIVYNLARCPSQPLTRSIHISKVPKADFTFPALNCQANDVVFTDRSTTPESTINTWKWDFGDGTPVQTVYSAQPIAHKFAMGGTYRVKLTIETLFGCVDVTLRDVVVNNSPVASFTVPASCVSDVVTFTNTSTIPDNSQAQFTCEWDFGDGSPRQIAINGTHLYALPGEYDVILTVTSNKGCTSVITRKVKINGTQPVAQFDVIDGNTFCGGKDVFIRNTSFVRDGGDITKVVIYYESLYDPIVRVEDNDPYPGKSYVHRFPVFQSNAGRQYFIRMVAYSGTGCVSQNSARTTLIINPKPVLDFNIPAEICQNAGILSMASADISQSGITGNRVYSGPGVTGNSFDPKVAGVGTKTITCIFYYNVSGCADTVSRNIIVKASPIVNAGEDISVLQGGSVALKASATGTGLTYQWSPAIGLSNANVLHPIVTGGAVDVLYTLTVTNSEGCSEVDSIKVTSIKFPIVPNTFTPNGDGVNDLWDIKHLNTASNCTVDVFNRYGQKVYSTVGYAVPWDGRSRGADLAAGVYYYIIDPRNGLKRVAGYITIIR